MSILQKLTAVTNSAARYWYTPAVNSNDGVVDYLSGYASNANFSDEKLTYSQYDDAGSLISGPVKVGDHSVPSTDSSTGAIFDNQYNTFQLSDSAHAIVYTSPTTQDYNVNDLTSLKFESRDDAGDLIQGPTTLKLGGNGAVKDLYAVNEGSLADFGNSFVVTYSTYDPQSGASKIKYTQFDESGDPLESGTLRSFNDDSHHGIDFGSFYTAENPNSDGSPNYILMNRAANSGSKIQVELLDTEMQQVASTTFSVKGPQGETSTGIDKYDYLRPGTGSADDFGVLSATYGYQDASGNQKEGIELEKVDPVTLQVLAKAFITDNNGSQTGVGLEHLSNGNVLAIYNDGGQSYVKEFNQSLHQVGNAYALPKDNDGWDNIVALGQDQFQIDWRQNTGSGTTVKHSTIFQA